jgi:hypothetical protein
MKLELSIELINKLLVYLGDQPYKEVVDLINASHTEATVAQSKPIPETVPLNSIVEVPTKQ